VNHWEWSLSFGDANFNCICEVDGTNYGNGSRNCATCGFGSSRNSRTFGSASATYRCIKSLQQDADPVCRIRETNTFNPRPCILEETAESGRFVWLARCCCSCKLRPFRGNPAILLLRTSHTCICSVLVTNWNSLPPFGSARYAVAD
jgi:hypothetical protein